MRGIVIFGVVVLLIVAIFDLTSNPETTGAACALDLNVLFPDRCTGDCGPGSSCLPVETRPYLLILSQAASCADLCSIDVGRRSAAQTSRAGSSIP